MTALNYVILSAMLLAAAAVVARGVKRRVNIFWGLLAVLLSGGAMLLCASAKDVGMLHSAPGGDPRGVVSSFFDDIVGGDYEGAAAMLSDYAGLGLENAPEDARGRLLYDALTGSYSYELVGECTVEGMSARQDVRFTCLDLNALRADIKDEVNAVLSRMAEDMTKNELYEDGNYRPEITSAAYDEALANLLGRAREYYAPTDIGVELRYGGGVWLITGSSEMFSAFTGGMD